VGLTPTGKRRLFTAHTQSGHPLKIYAERVAPGAIVITTADDLTASWTGWGRLWFGLYITAPGANLSAQRAGCSVPTLLTLISRLLVFSCDGLDTKEVPDGTDGQVPAASNSCAVCIQWFAIRSIIVLCSSRLARAAQREHCAANARYSLGETSAERMFPLLRGGANGA